MSALLGRLGRPLADCQRIAAQIADSRVDLGQGQPHLRHFGSLSTRAKVGNQDNYHMKLLVSKVFSICRNYVKVHNIAEQA